MNWHDAWDAYARNHVATQAAARLIRRFLLNTIAAGAEENDDAKNSDADKSEDDAEIPPLHMRAPSLQELLLPPQVEDPQGTGEGITKSLKNE